MIWDPAGASYVAFQNCKIFGSTTVTTAAPWIRACLQGNLREGTWGIRVAIGEEFIVEAKAGAMKGEGTSDERLRIGGEAKGTSSCPKHRELTPPRTLTPATTDGRERLRQLRRFEPTLNSLSELRSQDKDNDGEE